MPNKINKPKHKITREQTEYIMGEDKKYLSLIENNVYCGNCCTKNQEMGIVTIVDHIFYIDSFSDIILDGKCKNCGGHVVRCTETGENKEAHKRAREIIKMK